MTAPHYRFVISSKPVYRPHWRVWVCAALMWGCIALLVKIAGMF